MFLVLVRYTNLSQSIRSIVDLINTDPVQSDRTSLGYETTKCVTIGIIGRYDLVQRLSISAFSMEINLSESIYNLIYSTQRPCSENQGRAKTFNTTTASYLFAFPCRRKEVVEPTADETPFLVLIDTDTLIPHKVNRFLL